MTEKEELLRKYEKQLENLSPEEIKALTIIGLCCTERMARTILKILIKSGINWEVKGSDL